MARRDDPPRDGAVPWGLVVVFLALALAALLGTIALLGGG